jgi:hypothetical protein
LKLRYARPLIPDVVATTSPEQSSLKKFAYQPAVPFSLRCAYVAGMSATEITGEKQRPAHLFKPGVSGNPSGRPKGARSRLSESFIADLHTVWEESGIEALRTCAAEKPNEFCRIVALLMPRDLNLSVSVNPVDFAARFRSAIEMLGNQAPPPRVRRPLPGQRIPEHKNVG